MAPGPHDLQLMKALKAHRAGSIDEAREILEAILVQDADHADSLEVLGKIISEQGDLDRAIELTGRLAELKPDSIMAHANLSRYWMLKGDKEIAEEWQAKARVLGWKEEMGRKAGAAGGTAPTERPIDPADVQRQEESVEKDPDSVVARMALATSYMKLSMPIKAVGHLREALKRDAQMSVIYLNLGKALEAANLIHDAVQVYREGVPIADKKGDLMPRNQMQSRLAAIEKKGTPS